MKKVKNVTLINAITSLLLQLSTIISGFVIPRLILQTFGSEVNGLISSLNQFLNYITILEGGVSSVIMANLYKPLLNNDVNKVSSVVKTTQSFFKKIAIIFLIYSVILAVVYPLIVKQNFSYLYVSSLVLILAINIFVQYNFSFSWRLLLNADKKVYKVSIIQIGLIILNTVLFAILINFFPNIHFLKLVTALVYILQPIIYNIIIKKHYKIDKKVEIDKELLKDRWAGFGINIAAFIHFNTDVTILSVFTDLKVVSIYTVYNLITTGLRQIVMSVSSGIVPSIGHEYNTGNTEKLNKAFDHYEFVITFITFFLFVIGGLLITPFVMIYTKGVTDIDYYQPALGIILLIAEAIYCIRDPFVGLSYSAKKFKDIKVHAYIESIINIVLSVILVYKFKLIGVAIGTLVAMTYRTIFHVIYLKKNILYRPIRKFVKNIVIFGAFTCIGIIICNVFFSIVNVTILSWIIHAIIYCLVFAALYLIMLFIFYKDELIYYKNTLLKFIK